MTHTHEYDHEHQGQIAMAMGGIGVVLAQTLIEIDKTGQALEILRRHAVKMQYHFQNLDEATEARVMFGSFAQSLHEEIFFPPSA